MARSYAKGARGEREVRDRLKHLYPDVRRRAPGAEALEGVGRDLDGTPGLCVQVQLADQPRPLEKLQKAVEGIRAAPNGLEEIPVAYVRRTGGEWAVVLRASDFETFLSLALTAWRRTQGTQFPPE